MWKRNWKLYYFLFIFGASGFYFLLSSLLHDDHKTRTLIAQSSEGVGFYAGQLIRENISSMFEESEECPTAGYLTVFDGGRLGNQMSQYATLWAHANRLGVPAVISPTMKDKITVHFPNVRLPVANPNCSWKWQNVTTKELNSWTLEHVKNQNSMIIPYVKDVGAFKFFQHQLVTQEFAFDLELLEAAKGFLQSSSTLKFDKSKIVTFVSIHIRRTDYKNWLSNYNYGDLASRAYFSEAMSIFRKKYVTLSTAILFVIASDDMDWCERMFLNESDVVLTSSSSSNFSNLQPTFDLAILSQCNHSILSYGTFGFWSAFLKRQGDVIMPTGSSKKQSYLESLIRSSFPKWHFINDPCFLEDSTGIIKLIDDCN